MVSPFIMSYTHTHTHTHTLHITLLHVGVDIAPFDSFFYKTITYHHPSFPFMILRLLTKMRQIYIKFFVDISRHS